jgi:hypothetical protein
MSPTDQETFFAGAAKYGNLALAFWEVATDADSMRGDHEQYTKLAFERAAIAAREQLRVELGRAYRAIRGMYTAHVAGEKIPQSTLAYHSPTIAAAIRFVDEGAMDGSEYFVGKPVDVLHAALKLAEAGNKIE